jgi:TonB-dependent receptor
MSKQSTSRSSTLLAAVIAGILAASAAHAGATDTDGAAGDGNSNQRDAADKKEDALEEITVLAQRTTLEIARAAQEQSLNLINLTTAEEMKRLPDVNTGEAVRRIPGISLETDTGEGRYVNIRGLDADLNSTTFGGLRLPPTNNSSPSGAGRAVAFDSIPVGFVGAIKVTKSNLPEQDAEALGGTIDITPKTAPPDGKPFAEFKLGSGEELLRHTSIIDVAGTAGTRFGGPSGGYQPFSILVTASTYDDRRGIDDAEAGFVDNQPSVPDKAIAGFDQRYYRYHRERHGYGADLGWAPDEENKYFIRYYDAGYSETVDRNMLTWNFNAVTPAIVTPQTGPATLFVDPNNPNGFIDVGNFTKKLRDEKEYLDSKVAEIGGKNEIDENILDYHVGYTKGTYYKPYDYNTNFNSINNANVAYDNTSNPNWPVLRSLPGTPSNGTVTTDPTDPTQYTLGKLASSTQHSDDHEWGIGANLALPTHFTDAANEQIKVGLNLRLRTKTGDATSYVVNSASLPNLSLANAVYGSPVTYYQNNYAIGPLINGAIFRNLMASEFAAGNVYVDPVAQALNNVHDKEDVYAAYGQYQFGFGPLGIIAGARVEKTKATYGGYSADSSATANPACPIPDKVNQPTTHVCAVSGDRDYTNFFPTAQARYEFDPDLIGRLAISSTIARPGFQQVTSSTVVDGSGNTTTGNPNLKPTTATGLDLALEKYLHDAGIASIGLFAKDIKDYIVNDVAQVAGGVQKTGGNLGIVTETSYENASTAHLYGLEANFVKRFRELPGAFGGLGVSANWTWVDSRISLPVADPNNNNLTTATRDQLLPSTSRNTANFEITYDMFDVNATLGAYYTSRNIFAVGNSAALDIWTQDRVSLDFGSQYQIAEPVSVYFNIKNLTNTALKFTEGEAENRVIQREYYGITLQFGVNLKF